MNLRPSMVWVLSFICPGPGSRVALMCVAHQEPIFASYATPDPAQAARVGPHNTDVFDDHDNSND